MLSYFMIRPPQSAPSLLSPFFSHSLQTPSAKSFPFTSFQKTPGGTPICSSLPPLRLRASARACLLGNYSLLPLTAHYSLGGAMHADFPSPQPGYLGNDRRKERKRRKEISGAGWGGPLRPALPRRRRSLDAVGVFHRGLVCDYRRQPRGRLPH